MPDDNIRFRNTAMPVYCGVSCFHQLSTVPEKNAKNNKKDKNVGKMYTLHIHAYIEIYIASKS